jgi:hypothetical protein
VPVSPYDSAVAAGERGTEPYLELMYLAKTTLMTMLFAAMAAGCYVHSRPPPREEVKVREVRVEEHRDHHHHDHDHDDHDHDHH